MPVHTVLYDLDGTLIDSFPGIVRCASAALEEFGYAPRTTEEYRTFVGPPLVESFARHGVRPEDVAGVVSAYRRHYADGGIYEYRLYDGVVGTLHELHRAGITLGVATLKPQEFARRIIEHAQLTEYFRYVAGTSSDHANESKADVIRDALTHLDVTPSYEVVMVGDREHDAFGAHDVGTAFIGAGWGFGSREELANAHATRYATSPCEVVRFLNFSSVAS